MSLQSLHLSENEAMENKGQEATAIKCAEEDKMDETQESERTLTCDKDTSLISLYTRLFRKK